MPLVGTVWWQSTAIYAGIQQKPLSVVTVGGGTVHTLVSLPVNFDFAKLIPYKFLKTDAGQELVQAINNWIAPIWEKILNLKYLMDPENSLSVQYLTDTFNNVGFPRDLILDLNRGINLFKIASPLWSQQSSKKFYEAVNYLTTSDLNYKDLSEDVLYYSNNDNWSDKRFQDADYYREGAFSTNVTASNIELIHDVVRSFFTAGYFLYFIFSFGVDGGLKYKFGDTQILLKISQPALKYTINHISITSDVQQTVLKKKAIVGVSIISNGKLVYDIIRINIS